MLEELAKRWVPGEGPVEVEPLTSGLVNRSYRVTRAGRDYSLRVEAAGARGLGVDRRWECRIRAVAAARGLAAAVHHCDPLRGILVADWAPGRCWTPAEIEFPQNIAAMAELLRRVHSLKVPEPARRMNPAQWIALYTAAARHHAHCLPVALRDGAANRLDALGPPIGGVLCHSDLHRMNVMIGDRELLLDWEYTHVSDPLWDLAGWVANNDWPAATAQCFLASYLSRAVRTDDEDRLGHFVWLYDYVCVLWSNLYALQRPGAPSDSVRARARVLTARLISASGSRAG